MTQQIEAFTDLGEQIIFIITAFFLANLSTNTASYDELPVNPGEKL